MSDRAMTIAALYTLFAGISTAINIGTQMLFNTMYAGPFAVELSIIAGTATGMPLRYFLEKKYVFLFKSDGLAHDGQLFVLYGVMGVFTTAIFWGVEYGFHLVFGSDTMRYVGGVVGLAIGFYVKYLLDRKFVFVNGRRRVEI